ncbi:MAG: hypothetical protein ACR2OZ_10535 [Verrucomicrobiales bacterium]
MNFSLGIDESVLSGAGDAAERRRAAREAARADLEAMSAAMIREQGLLNHAQAGLILDVSTKRISELVRLGKLTRLDFMGRTYVSMKEVRERRDADLSAGRPKRNFVERLVTVVKMSAQTDPPQALLGGYDGPSEKEKAKQNRRKK